jgi:hypothetical protein
MFLRSHIFSTINDLNATLTSGRYLLLVAQNVSFEIENITKEISFCGAIFPQVVFGQNHFDDKIIAIELAQDTSYRLIKDMHCSFDDTFLQTIRSIVIFVDGLSPYIDDFLERAFENINEDTSIIGGGAGKLTLVQEPVIFDNDGIHQDSAICVYSSDELGIGVQHGWEELEGPFMVNACDKNIIKEINFTPAFEFYKKIVEADSSKTFDDQNFFDIAKGYPVGIVRYNKEPIVRDPITTQDDQLTLVGSIYQNSVINILKGDKKRLIEASKTAAKLAKDDKTSPIQNILLIDCISRFLFLESQFPLELQSIKNTFANNLSLWGALTLGEIANNKGENIEFYNKTCVVGAI